MFSHTARKPGGCFTLVDPAGINIERDTKQCCHCGTHWLVEPGSGKIRGFCASCNKDHCGNPSCFECDPFEKRMERYEKGESNTW